MKQKTERESVCVCVCVHALHGAFLNPSGSFIWICMCFCVCLVNMSAAMSCVVQSGIMGGQVKRRMSWKRRESKHH